MKKAATNPASPEQWTLIRGARQLLTLRGSGGPRRGPALAELRPIHDGAILIRNGVVHETGPSRRVENLAEARKAREIDASGKLVMPAFVDPDGVLIYPPPAARADPDQPEHRDESNLRMVSRRLLEIGGASLAADRVRSGCLVLGAHTAYASNLRDTLKVLRAHRTLQGKPLRIRSVVSPRLVDETAEARTAFLADLDLKWLPVIRKGKLSSVLELHFKGAGRGLTCHELREAAVSAASRDFLLRMRVEEPLPDCLRELACEAGVISILGFEGLQPYPPDAGIIHVLPAAQPLTDDRDYRGEVRSAIESGMTLAISSGYRTRGIRCANPQYLIRLAIDRLGMRDEEAITASTYNAACALRMAHVTGSIEPGKSADLIVVDLPDYRELARRVGHNDTMLAMRSGVVVYRRPPLGEVGIQTPIS